MQRTPGEAFQRLCPSCGTLAYTSERRCPWCGSGYARRRWPALLTVALIQAAIVLGGVALMLQHLGDELDSRLDDEVARVEREIDANAGRIREDVRAELDRRLPLAGSTP